MIAQVELLLHQLIGLDVASVGRASLERALDKRLKLLQCTPERYWQQLNQSTVEQQALIEAIVVSETWFFRYPESFVTLVALARQLLAQELRTRSLRILSLPCSSGEEPYSIAMSLLDAGIAPEAWQIHALDISEQALARAAKAEYGRNAFRSPDLQFRERHFSQQGDSYLLGDPVRQQVSFRAGNLFAMDAPLAAYDIIFCRNLLIYFDRATQLKALAQLQQWLVPDGYLFAGPAEAGLLSQEGMVPLDYPHSFAFAQRSAKASELVREAKRPRERPPQALLTRSASVQKTPVQTPVQASVRPHSPRQTSREAKPDSPPKPAPSPAVVTDEQASLAAIVQLANSGQSQAAFAACAAHLDRYGASAGLFYWWGLLWDNRGNREEAERYYRKVLYLEPEHQEALAQLAMIRDAQGDVAGAMRLRQRLTQGARRPLPSNSTGGLGNG